MDVFIFGYSNIHVYIICNEVVWVMKEIYFLYSSQGTHTRSQRIKKKKKYSNTYGYTKR